MCSVAAGAVPKESSPYAGRTTGIQLARACVLSEMRDAVSRESPSKNSSSSPMQSQSTTGRSKRRTTSSPLALPHSLGGYSVLITGPSHCKIGSGFSLVHVTTCINRQ